MIFINSLINDFYSCCYLPICVLDENLNTLCKCGYTSELEDILKEIDMIKKLKNLNFDSLKNANDITFLDYPKEIKFVVTPYFKHNDKSICFLLGPFTFKENSCKCKISTKNLTCIKYIYELLNLIFKETVKVTTTKNYSPYVRRALSYINENYQNPITIDSICNNFNINKSYFCNIFKKETNYTFTNYLNYFRIEKSKELLSNTDLSILDIALMVGYTNQSYYSTMFKKFTTITPVYYRNRSLHIV